MHDVIFAIKPKYVEKIFSCEKRFEYRTSICKQKIKKMIIYETSPVSKVVGEVLVQEVLKDTPKNIWNKTKEFAGIDEKSFFEYFKNREYAYAYVLKSPTKFQFPRQLEEFGITAAPQSFVYVKDN